MVGTAWEVAATVVDPEIPVLTIEDLVGNASLREERSVRATMTRQR